MKPTTISTIPIPIPDTTFTELCDYMDEVRCKRHIAFVAGEAIRAWIAKGRARAAEASEKAIQGYQWKSLFLPSGTRLKTRVRGRTFYAAVEGDCIKHEGKEMSPHTFANAFGVAGRNAWRDIWIHLPYDGTWKLAAELKKLPAD